METRNRKKATPESSGVAFKPDTMEVKQTTTSTPGCCDGTIKTFTSILYSIFATFLSTDASTALNRSAIFLIFFLIVHMLGNLFIFAGLDAFNTYGYFLHINPLLKFIEAYLCLGFVTHTISGCFKSYKKRNAIKKSPFVQGRLLLSSLVVFFFVLLHLYSFKFGNYYTHVSTDDIYIPIKGTVLKGTEMRDIYKLALEVFADPIKTWIYIISILIIGYHMWYGWSKTIMNNYNKMGLTKEYKKIATHFGHVVVVLVTVGFLSSPIYIHYFLLGQVPVEQ